MNIPYLFIFLLNVASFSQIHAQTPSFERTYGGSGKQVYGLSVQTPDGGYLLVGNQTVSSSEDIYLVRTDSIGDTLWTRMLIRDGTHERPRALITTSDGGFAVVGTESVVNSNYRHDFYLLKLDSMGQFSWDNTYGISNSFSSDYGHDVKETPDKGFILAGFTSTTGSISSRLVKTDSVGNEEWFRQYSKSVAYGVNLTLDKGYILTGNKSFTASTPKNLTLQKTDSLGNLTWEKQLNKGPLGLTIYNRGEEVFQLPDSGYAVGATLEYCVSCTTHVSDFWFVRTDANGDSLFTQTFGTSGKEFLTHMSQTDDGGYILTGRTPQLNPASSHNDIYVVKIDSMAQLEWDRTYGLNSIDLPATVGQDMNGGYFLSGALFNTTNYDLFLYKLDDNGCFNSSTQIQASAMTLCVGDSISLAADSGYSYLWSTGDTTSTILIDSAGTYSLTLSDTYGCSWQADTIHIQTLPALTPLVIADSTTTCLGDSLFLTISDTTASYLWSTGDTTMGIYAQTSGQYYAFVSNSCASRYSDTVSLTFLSDSSDMVQQACNSFEFFGQIYTASGQYTQVLSNMYACDSVVSLNLTIDSLQTASIVQQGNTLFAPSSATSYQWLDCQNNFMPIQGATTDSLSPAANGSYAVRLSNGICEDTTACFMISSVGITPDIHTISLSISPNPATDRVHISWDEAFKANTLFVLDMQGRIVMERKVGQKNQFKLNIKSLAHGVYTVRLEAEGSIGWGRIFH